jgi:hypothetical protein
MNIDTVYSYTVWINDPESLFDGVNNVFCLQHGSKFSNTNPCAEFDLVNNTVTFPVGLDIAPDPSGKVEDYPNGWKKLTASFVNTGSGGGPRYYLRQLSNNTGNLTRFAINGQKFYAFGFQIEQGSFPTSYIPTSGSTLIRAADVCKIEGDNFSSWYNQSEGTIFAEFPSQTYAMGTVSRILSFADDAKTTMSGGNGILFGSHTGSVETQRWRVRGTIITFFNIPTFVVKKTALAYAPNDLARVDNGINLETSTNSPPTVVLNQMHIFPMNTSISRLAYYSERLTNEQLEAITL